MNVAINVLPSKAYRRWEERFTSIQRSPAAPCAKSWLLTRVGYRGMSVGNGTGEGVIVGVKVGVSVGVAVGVNVGDGVKVGVGEGVWVGLATSAGAPATGEGA